MAKSPLERQIESQMKQAKQLADKKRREDEKRAREQKRMEQKAIVRDRASSIVNGQPLIGAFPKHCSSAGKVQQWTAKSAFDSA